MGHREAQSLLGRPAESLHLLLAPVFAVAAGPPLPQRRRAVHRRDRRGGIVDADGRGLGVVAADLDGDGRLDLFVANDQSANFLFRNKGGLRFEEIAGAAGVASSGNGIYQASMGVAYGDVDGDGRPDLAETNFYNESTTLYQNRGEGIFTDDTAASGIAGPSRFLLGFGAAFLDANNDGWLDLATANGHVDDFTPEVPWLMPAQLLLGTGGGRFVDVSDRPDRRGACRGWRAAWPSATWITTGGSTW